MQDVVVNPGILPFLTIHPCTTITPLPSFGSPSPSSSQDAMLQRVSLDRDQSQSYSCRLAKVLQKWRGVFNGRQYFPDRRNRQDSCESGVTFGEGIVSTDRFCLTGKCQIGGYFSSIGVNGCNMGVNQQKALKFHGI
jgi:hypothetical protein